MCIYEAVDLYNYYNIRRTLKNSKKNRKNRFVLLFFYKQDDSNVNNLFANRGAEINNFLGSLTMFTIYDKQTFDKWGEFRKKKELADARFLVCQGDVSNKFEAVDRIAKTFGVEKKEYPALLVYDSATNKYTVVSMTHYTEEMIFDKIKQVKETIDKYYKNEGSGAIIKICSYLQTHQAPENNISFLDRVTEKEDIADIYKSIQNCEIDFIEVVSSALGCSSSTSRRKIDALINDKDYNVFTRDELIKISIVLKYGSRQCDTLLKSCEKSVLNLVGRDGLIYQLLNYRRNLSLNTIQEKLRENGYDIL